MLPPTPRLMSVRIVTKFLEGYMIGKVASRSGLSQALECTNKGDTLVV